MELQSFHYITEVEEEFRHLIINRVRTKIEMSTILKPEQIEKFMTGKHRLQIVFDIDGARAVEAHHHNGKTVILGDNISIKAEIVE
jgi:hypothetical protein